MRTEEQVVEDFAVGGAHAALGAVAGAALHQLRQPAESGVVDGLGDVEAEVEAAVVAALQDQHELARPMLRLADEQFGVLLLEVVGVDEGGLVPQVLTALAEVLREVGPRLLLQDPGLLVGDGVPELRLPLVQVVDRRQIQVLLVPAEQRLPGTHVAVRSGHPAHVAVDGVAQHGVQSAEVPGTSPLVHQRIEEVGAVEGGRKNNIFPKLSERLITISSTSLGVRESVILSKTPILSLYSLRERDFFWMWRHS